MKLEGKQIRRAVLALALAFAGMTAGVMATEDDDAITEEQIVRQVIISSEECPEGDCEHQIRVETRGDGSHNVHFGDHEMIWVGDGAHGSHFSFGDGLAGKGGFLGVQLTDLTPELRSHFGVAADEGVMVAKVVDDSAAFRAGLAAGDIITRVDGETIGSSRDLTHMIRSHEEGETVVLEIWRDGSLDTISAALDKNEQLARIRRHVMVDCEDGDEGCGGHFMARAHPGMDIDCPDGEQCEVRIDCDEGDCECTENGEIVDCEDLHTEHGHGD